MESQGLLANESYTRTFRRGQKPSQGDNQKRKIFYVFDFLIGIVGIILFGFAALVSIKKGWSEHGIHDINSEIMTALYMCAIFSIFTSVIGFFGAYTRWKTLIVTFSILSLMCLAFNSYIVICVMSVQKNANRDMARAWWDVIRDDDKINIQDTHSCCGYLNIRDNAIPSTTCPKELIETYTLVGDDVKEPANVMKKDSYYKQNSDKINIKTTAGNVSPVNGANTAQDNVQDTGGVGMGGAANGPVGAPAGAPGNAANAANANAATANPTKANAANPNAAAANAANTAADPGVGDELKKRQIANAEPAAEEVGAEEVGADEVGGAGGAGNGVGGVGGAGNGVGGAGGAGNGVGGAGGAGGAGNGVGGVDGAGNGVGGVGGAGNGVGGVGGAGANTGADSVATTAQATTKNSGKTTGEIDPSVPAGCSEYLKTIVESKLKTVYMGLTGLCIAYPLGSIMGYIYWKALREFKEYDEFA